MCGFLGRWRKRLARRLFPGKQSTRISVSQIVGSATVYDESLVADAEAIRDGVRRFIECPTLLSLRATKSSMEQYLDRFVCLMSEKNLGLKKCKFDWEYNARSDLIEERHYETLGPSDQGHPGGGRPTETGSN